MHNLDTNELATAIENTADTLWLDGKQVEASEIRAAAKALRTGVFPKFAVNQEVYGIHCSGKVVRGGVIRIQIDHDSISYGEGPTYAVAVNSCVVLAFSECDIYPTRELAEAAAKEKKP